MNSFKNSFKEKARLNRLGRKLLRSRDIAGVASPSEWLEAMTTIERYRKSRRRAAGWTITLLIFSILVTIFTLIIAELYFTIGGLLGLIVAIVLLGRLTKVKFHSQSADLLCPVVATLREDMKPGAPLKITLDYSGPTAFRKKKSSRKVPAHELMKGVRSRTEHFYEDPWLIIEGKLIDQTGFRIFCQNDTREAKITKRSASGKSKLKWKCKHKAVQLVTLKPPTSARQCSPPPNTACPAEIKEREDGFSIVASNRFAGERKPHAPNVKADLLLDLFACAVTRYH